VTDPVRVADSYITVLARLSARSSASLLRIWDSLGSYTEADGDRFHTLAQPVVERVALATIKATEGYASTLGAQPGPVSDLIVPDALARLYDPFDRIGALLSNGNTYEDALAGGRTAAKGLGSDSVYRTARQTIAEKVTATEWQRRVSAGSCDWCMKLSRVTWPTAEAATFGHTKCDCVPLPKSVIGDRNQAIYDKHEFAETEKATHNQAKALRKQIDNAKSRQASAKAEQSTETDPARLERLSVREQEWETRAERAEEQLRILETGTHRR
jgi:hypothetical protein